MLLLVLRNAYKTTTENNLNTIVKCAWFFSSTIQTIQIANVESYKVPLQRYMLDRPGVIISWKEQTKTTFLI